MLIVPSLLVSALASKPVLPCVLPMFCAINSRSWSVTWPSPVTSPARCGPLVLPRWLMLLVVGANVRGHFAPRAAVRY
jgi:hypothetical protein